MSMRTVNVGSAVRTFEVENAGNVPWQGPTSLLARWQMESSTASTSLDAGPGNEFQKARVSCMQPLSLHRSSPTDRTAPARKSQRLPGTVRPATFLVEAEVVHTMQSPIEHRSYPVVFGSALSFTLPTDSEGVSMEADVAGETLSFRWARSLPSWASCNSRMNPDHTSVYRCELKPGYRFQ